MKVEWTDEFERENFFSRGMDSFKSFWKLEKSGADIEYKSIRKHIPRGTKVPERQIACIKFEQNIKYFLKRGRGKEVNAIKNEFDALKIIQSFGFKTAKLIAYAFDDDNKRAFILLKNLAAYLSLDDIVSLRLSPDMIAKYQVREKEILSKLAQCIRSYQNANYFYPDLKAKHIFVNPNNADVALVDLERFLPASTMPFYCKIKLCRAIFHAKEIKKLLQSLSKNRLTMRALEKLLQKRGKSNA